MMDECEATLNNFDSTRLKLKQILRRHEKIDAMLQDAQQRVGPIHFLLSISDQQNTLNINQGVKTDNAASPNFTEQKGLNSPYTELKTLRHSMNELNKEELLENMSSGDWKKILRDLDAWYLRMEPTESVESIRSDVLDTN